MGNRSPSPVITLAGKTMTVLFGIFTHAIGGASSASFYIPSSGQRHWSHETYWLIQSFFSWCLLPLVVAYFTIPHLLQVLAECPGSAMVNTLLLGFVYGFGGFAFGLGLRYIGLGLTYAIAIGISSGLGTIVPLVQNGQLGTLLNETSGQVVLAAVALSLVGIGLSGYAGFLKERSGRHKSTNITREFHFTKGLLFTVAAGVLSAVFKFALDAGEPLKIIAQGKDPKSWMTTNIVFIFAMGGAFLNNFLWCLITNLRNKSLKEYVSIEEPGHLKINYLLAASGGTLWYFQFFFYGMAENFMGPKSYASWAIHMTFLILFSMLWSLALGEWKGAPDGARVKRTVAIAILIAAIAMIGFSDFLSSGATPK